MIIERIKQAGLAAHSYLIGASLAASILRRAGYPRVYNVLGGVSTWVSAGFPVTG